MNIAIIQVYAPTTETEDEIESFYAGIQEKIYHTKTKPADKCRD